MFPESFEGCCNEHDKCYDTCNRSKEFCDVAFQNCLNKICQSGYSLIDLACKKILPFLVAIAGCSEYKSAQEKACVCH